MSTVMYIHHVINIILMIILSILEFTHFGGTVALIVLSIFFIINNILLFRSNSKQVKDNGTTLEDFNKK
ncbi:hypothetical protein BU600_01220 [Staphylococcus arlettae]|jgi:uncharacterized membrane protein|nr:MULTISPECIES: hypothetical protein [Staphylococcus]NKE85327.1 hypothetical protein [Staphylococcus arlettae]PTH28375.1 hypothetical protein BU605_04880 [Staphylococcus arlettae]PTH55212.1 hypothetical protein BU597_00855 [Staphylococcus arlettae]PTH56934.1 hypothetical protein BU601_02500 [Staphylococcus arlettae]RIM63246.1 hypothetical protein BU598_00180 [Staphylococcus arlettae]